MRKILTLCVSVLLSLSFIVPLSLYNALIVDAFVDSCYGYNLMNSTLKTKYDQQGSSIDVILYNDYRKELHIFYNTTGYSLSSSGYISFTGGKHGIYNQYGTYTDESGAISITSFSTTGTWYVLKNKYDSSVKTAASGCSVKYYSVSTSSSLGGTVTGGGSYVSGTTAVLEAIPDVGSVFLGWSDGSTDNPRRVVVSSNVSLTANFKEVVYYDLSLNILEGFGQVLGAGKYASGSSVEIQAVPNTHYSFVSWSDGNTDNPRTLIIEDHITLNAVFLEDPKFNVEVEVFGNGSVTGTGEYYEGTEVMLSAVPGEGYYFKSWNDGSIDPAKVITVTGDITVAAVFEEKSTRACYYSKDLVANPYVLKGVERAIHLVESNQSEDYWWIAKRIHNFILNIDGGYVPSGTAFVQPQSIEWVLAYHVNDQVVYESLGFENNVPGYYSFIHTLNDGTLRYHTLELIVGNNPGFEYVDSVGVSTSFELVSRYDQIQILDSYCWEEGYDSNYYDLLQYYELKSANSNLSNNTNELKDVNSNLSLIERGISGITDIIDSVPAKLTIISEHVYSVFEKLDHVISGLFDVESAVNDLIDSNDHQSQLIDGGTQVSQSVSNKNDSVTSELSDSISQHNQIEQEYQAQMNQAMSNIDFNVDVGNIANFSTTAAFISGQMDLMFNLDPALKMMFMFPLICGLAMLIIGRLKS